ncbi:hypothetical protein HZS_7560 [Henneguya salminicola]|nr:hypothetical protein HZS_7560 [Henneguya salminicola]
MKTSSEICSRLISRSTSLHKICVHCLTIFRLKERKYPGLTSSRALDATRRHNIFHPIFRPFHSWNRFRVYYNFISEQLFACAHFLIEYSQKLIEDSSNYLRNIQSLCASFPTPHPTVRKVCIICLRYIRNNEQVDPPQYNRLILEFGRRNG